MPARRVCAFIDGFNFYHAVKDLGANHLKWVDLWSLCQKFAPEPDNELIRVYYFSAYATWMLDSYRRHVEFVKANRARGVTDILGRFKQKSLTCKLCGREYPSHEEKESDVNLALHLFRSAAHDEYDRALLVTRDSDILPSVRLVRSEYPDKDIRLLAPPGKEYNMALVEAAGGLDHARRIKASHLEQSLLPQQVLDAEGRLAATRPLAYDPPPRT